VSKQLQTGFGLNNKRQN